MNMDMNWKEHLMFQQKLASRFHNNQINNHWYQKQQVATWEGLSDGNDLL